jgi:DNA-binding LytR/AlgR family response regulator
MKDVWNSLRIGLVLLSSDFHVIGLNDYARELYGPLLKELGGSVLQCHSPKGRAKAAAALEDLTSASSDMPRTMVIDVLGKVLMYNLSELSIVSPTSQTCWSVTFIDVSAQTDAETSPLSGELEMKKFPVYDHGTYHFLPTQSVYYIQSDGDYSKIFTGGRSFYMHSSLKNILRRFTGASFFRVHRGFVVNLGRVGKLAQDSKGQALIMFDDMSLSPIPVSRRKLAELKKAMHSLWAANRQLSAFHR